MSGPSLSGFLNFLKFRITMALRGEGITNKTRLFFWVFFNSIPNTIMRRLSFRRRYYVECLKERLVKNTVIRLKGSKFRCVDSGSITVLSPQFESWMWNHLNLGKGDVFVDVGAHIGKYTVLIAKVVGDEGLVIAVEPHPENYKTLMENVKLNNLKNVIALRMAAWSKEGKLKLFIGDSHSHHSIIRDYGFGSIYVQARTLDKVFEELKVEKIDYIKIDVEGAELEVLKGLVKTFKKHSPTVIVEVWKDPTKIKKIMNFVHKIGYEMRQISPEYYILEPRVKARHV